MGKKNTKLSASSATDSKGDQKTLHYLIKWLGYPDSDNTWEPAHQIHAPEMIKAYHRRTSARSYKNPHHDGREYNVSTLP